MANDTRSPREIERDLEREREQLRATVDQIFGRLTFQDAWTRVGDYMQENRHDLGHSVGRVLREKPIAVGLTAVGVAWLLFGPSSNRHSGRERPYQANLHGRIEDRVPPPDAGDGDGRGHGVSDRYGASSRGATPGPDRDMTRPGAGSMAATAPATAPATPSGAPASATPSGAPAAASAAGSAPATPSGAPAASTASAPAGAGRAGATAGVQTPPRQPGSEAPATAPAGKDRESPAPSAGASTGTTASHKAAARKPGSTS